MRFALLRLRAGRRPVSTSACPILTRPARFVDCGKIEARVKVRDAIKLVELDGWKLARMRGSHRQYHHPVKPGTVTIAGHPSMELDPKTQSSILKQAGLK